MVWVTRRVIHAFKAGRETSLPFLTWRLLPIVARAWSSLAPRRFDLVEKRWAPPGCASLRRASGRSPPLSPRRVIRGVKVRLWGARSARACLSINKWYCPMTEALSAPPKPTTEKDAGGAVSDPPRIRDATPRARPRPSPGQPPKQSVDGSHRGSRRPGRVEASRAGIAIAQAPKPNAAGASWQFQFALVGWVHCLIAHQEAFAAPQLRDAF